ncbi:MAG: class I SAM-dependent methyltransferase [Candidatus Riflemargulisbacteria bacterium]
MRNKIVATRSYKSSNGFQVLNLETYPETANYFATRKELFETTLMKEILGDARDAKDALKILEWNTATNLKLLGTLRYYHYSVNCFEYAEIGSIRDAIRDMIKELSEMSHEDLQEFFSRKCVEISIVNRYYTLLPYIEAFINKSTKSEISILDIGCAPQGKEGAPTIERLLEYLKQKFPDKIFNIVGSDIKIPEGLTEHNDVTYEKDDISNTKFDGVKFDIVIVNKVFFFNGITAHQYLYTKAFENAQKLASDGLLFFDSAKDHNFMFMYERGKLTSKFLLGDHYLFERECYHNRNLGGMIQYIKPFSSEMIAELLKVIPGISTLPDELALVTYMGILNRLFEIQDSITDPKWLRENTNLLQIQKNFWDARKIVFNEKMTFNIAVIKQRIVEYEMQVQKFRVDIIKAETEGKYPWLIYLKLFWLEAPLLFLKEIVEKPKEFEAFFERYIEYLTTDSSGIELKNYLKARMSAEYWDGKPLFQVIYDNLPESFKEGKDHLYEIPFDFVSIEKPMFRDGYKLVIRHSVTGEEAKVVVVGNKTFRS